VRFTVPPSAEIEEQIDQLLAVGVGENPRESLSEAAKLGARLIIQRAVEDEFDAWLGRRATSAGPSINGACATAFAPAACRLARARSRWGSRRSGKPPSRLSPSCSRGAPSCFAPSRLKALVIGAFVRGLSMRDVESLCQKGRAAP
jgi:putative transposase